MTSIIFAVIKYILKIPLRLDPEDLKVGDDSLHGESPYTYLPRHQTVIEMEGPRPDVANGHTSAQTPAQAPDQGAVQV